MVAEIEHRQAVDLADLAALEIDQHLPILDPLPQSSLEPVGQRGVIQYLVDSTHRVQLRVDVIVLVAGPR